MGPENKKRYTRRWFVLKSSELKYYRSHKDTKRPRGVIKLDSWCRLTKLKSKDAFELATPQRTFQLVAKNALECSEWLKGTCDQDCYCNLFFYSNLAISLMYDLP